MIQNHSESNQEEALKNDQDTRQVTAPTINQHTGSRRNSLENWIHEL